MYFCRLLRLFALILILIRSSLAYAQPQYPQHDFRSPLDIPLSLAGNFGELRPNHFHAGIDIKTGGEEGKHVYAVDDGYVSRVKISPFAYGKSVYITHPNGYVSVYAHLKSLSPKIDRFVRNAQYERKTYQIDIYPAPKQLPVKKSEVIALSGNTGTSGGPHLHFEIRDAVTEHAINPLLFNFEVTDNIKPKIFAIYIYPQDKKSYVNHKNKPVAVLASGNDGKFSIPDDKTPVVHGNIGFAIEASDYLNGTSNKCGIYSIEFYKDTTMIYKFLLNEFSFWETKYINSHMDYSENIAANKEIHKCFLEPNNGLKNYPYIVNRGIVSFNDDSTHKFTCRVNDSYNNVSTIRFSVKSSHVPISKDDSTGTPANFKKIMPFGQANFYNDDGVKVEIPPYALYDTLYFDYSISPAIKGSYAPVHHIHNKYTPVNKNYTLAIKTNGLPAGAENKALVAEINSAGRMIPVGGSYSNGYVTAEVEEFGKYTVTIDSIPPDIRPVNDIKNKDLSKTDALEFKIADNFSGIDTYNGYIDNKWVLFEYEPKKNLIFYNFKDNRILKGKNHHLRLVVTDAKGNEAVYECAFYW